MKLYFNEVCIWCSGGWEEKAGVGHLGGDWKVLFETGGGGGGGGGYRGQRVG